MYFKQLVKEDLGCACYLVGCTNAAICAVVDPRVKDISKAEESETLLQRGRR